MAAGTAVVPEVTSKKKKKSIFGSIFHRKKSKKKDKTYAIAYIDTDVTSNPTQLPRHDSSRLATISDVIQMADDQSESSKIRPAPAPPNEDRRPSQPTDDVINFRANGVSRSSSRSSGFDEISSAVTEWSSQLPVSTAHAQTDKPEVNSPETVATCECAPKNDDCDVDSLDTLNVPLDNNNNDLKDETVSSLQHSTNTDHHDTADSWSSPGQYCDINASEKSEPDVKIEELSRQIESMSDRFNKLFARVKAAEQVELRRSTVSLNEPADRSPRRRSSITGAYNYPETTRPHRPTVVDCKYSRNTAYRQWLTAKALDMDNNTTRQTFPATKSVSMRKLHAPARHVTSAHYMLIGQQTSDDVSEDVEGEPAEFDDVTTSARVDGVTSAAEERCNKEVSRTPVSEQKTAEFVPDRPGPVRHNSADLRGVWNDLGLSFKTKQQPCTEGEVSVNSEFLENSVAMVSRDGPSSSVTEKASSEHRDDVSTASVSGTSYTSTYPPRDFSFSTSSQHGDVFCEDGATASGSSPSRAFSYESRLSPGWTRFKSSGSHPWSASVQPGEIFNEADSRQSSRDGGSVPRLRLSASYDAVPTLGLSRRRSFLEQSAEVKGHFARWHQLLTTSRSLQSSSASPTFKTSPLKALPLHTTSSSCDSTTHKDSELKPLPVVHSVSSSSSSTPDDLQSIMERSPISSEHRSCGVTSSWPATGACSHDDSLARLLADSGRPGRRLYRSDSLPAGGGAEAVRARAKVEIPRIAMARKNPDGTPKSILKKSVSVSNDCS